MTWQGRVAWLPCALLLLWGPGWYGQNDAQDRGGRDHPCLVPDEGCSSLSGPTSVTGTVGGSLSVQCQYEEKFRDIAKYWCKSPCVWNTVKTKEADREMRKGRVSIRDHPANLTFTVTLENLTEDDAGTYCCGINTSWLPGNLLDSTFLVVVFVTPATKSTPPVSITVTQMSKSTAKIMTTLAQPSSAAPTTMGATRSASSQEEFSPSQGLGLQVLLSLLALLLLLLGGSSLLAWRMVRRQVKYSENLEPLRTPSQATQQGEPHYENLELQMWPLREEPVHPRQAEVEYSTVKAPREELHYSSMVFDLQSGDSKAKKIRSQRTLEETQYGVIKKT